MRLDCLEPRTSEASVGDDDGLAAIGQHGLQELEELAVRLGAVVLLHWVDLLVDRDGSPPHRNGCLDHQPSSLLIGIGPVDQNEWALDSRQQSTRNRSIDGIALGVQMTVAQEPVRRLDVMLREGGARPMPSELCER
jgi:hypothetical protein